MRRPFSRSGPGRPFEPRPDAEVDAELEFHLEQRVREYIARGMDPEAARTAARERFGDLSSVKQECARLLADERRATARRDWLGDLRQDLAFGVRAAVRAPLFSVMAIATLALGIGANAAVFGVVKSVLLDALPYRDADRLVRIYGRHLHGTSERGPLSAGSVTDIAERTRSLERLAAFASLSRDGVHSADDGPRAVRIAWVEPALFPTLGVVAAHGRNLRDDDAQADTAFNIVLTHAAWHRLFGGDPGVVGRTARVNGISRTIVGVLPRDFVGPISDADFYFPLSLRASLLDPIGARGSHWLGAVGRLAPGVTVESVRDELVAIAADIAREHPRDAGSFSVAVLPIREAMIGDTRTPLLVLMASAALVLLITCANLAGALLSRTLARRKEFAVRVALGAGRGRLVRQLLTESLVLAIAGGVAGVLLAMLGLGVLRGLALPALPDYAELTLDGGAVLVTGALALVTGVAFGLAPALSVGRADPQRTLRDETRGASEGHGSRTLRGALVAGQIALCVSLLAGAGLLARSLWSLTAAPLGFQGEGVLAATVQLPPSRYPNAEARSRFIRQLEERLLALPGVSNVAATGELPTRVMNRNGFFIEGAPPPANDAVPFAYFIEVSDDYFRTLRIPLRAGRTFGPEDHPDAPLALVINESMARQYWPNGDAIGARLRLGPNPDATPFTVIGVVADVRNEPARADVEATHYVSNRQIPYNGPHFLVRTSGGPSALVRPLQRVLGELDPEVPLKEARPLAAIVGDGFAGRRLPVVLMSAFGALALLLASVGVYAMFAAMAAAREREFGVRVALGSSRAAIAGLVLRQGAVWMAVGLAGGAVGVVLVTRMIRNLLYGVEPFDPIALGAAIVLLLACAVLALLVPVRRATRVDPISVLR